MAAPQSAPYAPSHGQRHWAPGQSVGEAISKEHFLRPQLRPAMDGVSHTAEPYQEDQENRYRRVIRPYWNVIEPFVKQRWVGRTLLDVFSKEFPGGSPAYYADAIACGRIMVNRRRRDADYVLKGGDRLFHRLWRVEPPIPADSVDIVAEDDQWLVVDKPAGVPIHAGGGYLHNTLLSIMEREHKRDGLKVMHRLDRVTSGIVLFAKTRTWASALGESIQKRRVRKHYLALVHGRFPAECGAASAVSGIYPAPDAAAAQQRLAEGGPAAHEAAPTESDPEAEQRVRRRRPDAHCGPAFVLPAAEHALLWRSREEVRSAARGEPCGARLPDDAGGVEAKEAEAPAAKRRRSAVGACAAGAADGAGGGEPLPGAPFSLWSRLATVLPKAGLRGTVAGASEGQDALTSFQLLAYDPETEWSLVLCKPHTGRTHQLRVHLHALGHPIVSDPLYGPEEGREDYSSRWVISLRPSEEAGGAPTGPDDIRHVVYHGRERSHWLGLHALRYEEPGRWYCQSRWPQWAVAMT